MTIFSQAILKGALLPAHIAAGIELYEPDDHILVLRCKGEVIATYASTGALVSEIRKDAYRVAGEKRDETMKTIYLIIGDSVVVDEPYRAATVNKKGEIDTIIESGIPMIISHCQSKPPLCNCVYCKLKRWLKRKVKHDHTR